MNQPVSMIRKGALNGIDELFRDFETNSYQPLNKVYQAFERSKYSQDYITLAEYDDAIRKRAQMVNECNFGFIFGTRLDTRMLGPAGYFFSFAPTLGEALTLFIETFEGIQSNTEISIQMTDDMARVSYRVKDSFENMWIQDAENSLGILIGACARISGHAWSCKQLEFMHRRQGNDNLKTVLTGVIPTYSRHTNCFTFPKHLLNTQIPTYDPYLYSSVRNDAQQLAKEAKDRRSFSVTIVSCLDEIARQEQGMSLEELAREMGMSKRSIQSKLEHAGTSFRTEKNRAIMRRAQTLLDSGLYSITDVALELGFSETSAFSRAYKNHFGLSPSKHFSSPIK